MCQLKAEGSLRLDEDPRATEHILIHRVASVKDIQLLPLPLPMTRAKLLPHLVGAPVHITDNGAQVSATMAVSAFPH